MSAEPTREAVVKPCAYCGSSVIGHTPTECIITLRARVDVLERERDDRESLVRELRVTNASAQKALASLRAEADAMRAVVEAVKGNMDGLRYMWHDSQGHAINLRVPQLQRQEAGQRAYFAITEAVRALDAGRGAARDHA